MLVLPAMALFTSNRGSLRRDWQGRGVPECRASAFTTLLPCREGLLKQVPEMEGEFVKVPKIL